MVSDADVISTVAKWWLMQREGKRSLPEAGRECFEELAHLALEGRTSGALGNLPPLQG